ncbi:hypothetical protein VE00_02653 [Pseudogymnoascus sp. WSF 3629]|jgi:hypothetical protein|nr:hypothetical protein VE00_02653 [Pseudogymnoascus sp. WSF 3629]
MHNSPTAAHTTGAQPAPPPYQPPSQQTHSRGTQTTPAPPPSQNAPPKPPITLLEKLEKLDANLKVYAPVLLSILETTGPFLIMGLFMLAIVGGLTVRIVCAVVEVWWG